MKYTTEHLETAIEVLTDLVKDHIYNNDHQSAMNCIDDIEHARLCIKSGVQPTGPLKGFMEQLEY